MIYFDNAATTFPKPEAVYESVGLAMREHSGNPGRSAHRLAMLAERDVFACRETASELFGSQPENVIFTYNATYALNMALKSAYFAAESGSGGRKTNPTILISDLEHNSVRRPAASLTDNVKIYDSHVELPDGEGRTSAILASIKSKLPPKKAGNSAAARCILVSTAASNICSALMPVGEIGRLCRSEGVYFIVDGSQAAGTIDMNIERDCIDALCLPGHKGLYGPQGSGLLILGTSPPFRPGTFIEGGNGMNSLDVRMPELPPERYEGGTLAVAAISGLRAGMEFVRSGGMANLHTLESTLSNRLADKLESTLGPRIKLYARAHHGGILLFNIAGYASSEVGEYLDKNGICVRSGFHCSPLAHSRIGTGQNGAVRVSFGAFNTYDEVDTAAEVITQIYSRKRQG